MLMPSVFGDNLFDEMMRVPFNKDFWNDFGFQSRKAESSLMSTDIKENEGSYELDIELPGYKKEDIKAELKKGYLTIQAVRNVDNSQKDENGKYIRRERYSGSCQRSFYVGDAVTQEDVSAKFEDGILKLTVPKKDKAQVEQKQYIAIEG